MAEPVLPDPTRPDPGAGWPAHAIYQCRIFFREFSGSQLGMLLVTALLGYTATQSYLNAGHSLSGKEEVKAAVQTTHAETVAKVDATAADVKLAAAKSEEAVKVAEKTDAKVTGIATKMNK